MMQRPLISMVCNESVAVGLQSANNESSFWGPLSAVLNRVRLKQVVNHWYVSRDPEAN